MTCPTLHTERLTLGPATMAHYEVRLGQHREQAVEFARRALASGKLVASGSIAFNYAGMALRRSGLLDEAVSTFNQAIAQARRRGVWEALVWARVAEGPSLPAVAYTSDYSRPGFERMGFVPTIRFTLWVANG